MTLQRLCFRFAMGMVAALIVVGTIVILLPKYRQTLFLRAERERMNLACSQIELQIDELRRQQHRFLIDPEFVEHIARQNRRVRPNETVFVMQDAALE